MNRPDDDRNKEGASPDSLVLREGVVVPAKDWKRTNNMGKGVFGVQDKEGSLWLVLGCDSPRSALARTKEKEILPVGSENNVIHFLVGEDYNINGIYIFHALSPEIEERIAKLMAGVQPDFKKGSIPIFSKMSHPQWAKLFGQNIFMVLGDDAYRNAPTQDTRYISRVLRGSLDNQSYYFAKGAWNNATALYEFPLPTKNERK